MDTVTSPAALSLAPGDSSTRAVTIPPVGGGSCMGFAPRLPPPRSRSNRDALVRARLDHADVVVGR